MVDAAADFFHFFLSFFSIFFSLLIRTTLESQKPNMLNYHKYINIRLGIFSFTLWSLFLFFFFSFLFEWNIKSVLLHILWNKRYVRLDGHTQHTDTIPQTKIEDASFGCGCENIHVFLSFALAKFKRSPKLLKICIEW